MVSPDRRRPAVVRHGRAPQNGSFRRVTVTATPGGGGEVLTGRLATVAVVSVTVEKRVDPPGASAYAEDAWELKERIRRLEGVLKQRERFFMDAYRRATTHLLYLDEDLVGFATVRRDGYILFLAVAPERRGEGYGRRLVAEVADDHRTVTCHARTTNERALEFYEAIGFEIKRRIENYYEDDGDAYYLRLGPDERLRDRLSELLGR
jgi:ribosomal protein S18 acetylase RimI-like enzyme